MILTNAIIYAQKGLLNPSIITPAKLIEELNLINKNHLTNFIFPVPLQVKFAHHLLKALSFDMYFKGNKLVYIINIPLVEHQTFNIFKASPFPIITNENLLFIQPTTKYIAIDETQIHFIALNEKQYDNCIQITSTNIICKQEQPTAMANNLDNCELKLFTNSREVPKNCDKRIISSDQCIFVQLNNGKEWLFVAPKTETVTINCKLQPNPLHIDITGTGKLSLDNTCIGYTNHFILTPQGPLLSNEFYTDFVPRYHSMISVLITLI